MIARKAQVTAFIVTGIILLILVAGLLSMRESIRKVDFKGGELAQVPIDLRPVREHVVECIRETGENGINRLALQGGMIYNKKDYLDAEYSEIKYGYQDGEEKLPTLEELHAELTMYMNDILPTCVNFSQFPQFIITTQAVDTEVSILNENVIFDVRYPVKITKEGSITEIRDYYVSVPKRLGYMYSIIDKIVNQTLLDPDYIDTTYISKFDMNITIIPFDGTTAIFGVRERNDSDDTQFQSAFEYTLNQPPVISMSDEITMTEGEPFIYTVSVSDPEGDTFYCYDDTELFDITEDCMIFAVPNVNGTYHVTITAVDYRFERSKKEVVFTVRKNE